MRKYVCLALALLVTLACCVCMAEEEAHEHSWSNWTTVSQATCTAEGLQRRVCSECGAREEQKTPAAGHSWGSWTTVSQATCTAEGVQRRVCSECGAREEQKIAAIGHTEQTIAGKPAACTENGLTDGTKCAVCDTVIKAQETIPAKGHAEVIIPGKAATCTENGLTEGKKCSVCGEVTVEQQTINASGHHYEARRIAPTTTSKGYTKHTCSVCGDTYNDNWKSKLASSASVVTPVPTAEPQTGLYGSIVTNVNRDAVVYNCLVATLEGASPASEKPNNLLEIVAEADADGSYTLRNLHIAVEMLTQLKEDGIAYIRFIVGDASLLIPLTMFDNEDINVIVADMAQELTGYVITLDPNALTTEAESGYQVSAALTTLEDAATDITVFVHGMLLTVGEKTVEITENAAYSFQ